MEAGAFVNAVKDSARRLERELVPGERRLSCPPAVPDPPAAALRALRMTIRGDCRLFLTGSSCFVLMRLVAQLRG